MLKKVQELLTWKKQKSKSKIKKDNGIKNLTNLVIYAYQNQKWKYPLSVKDLKKINDANNDVLANFYNDPEFTSDFDDLIIEIFVDALKEEIEIFLKENKKYPVSIDQFNKTIWNTLKELKLKDKTFKILIKDFIVSEILKAPKTNKMRTLFKEAYIENKELFENFIYINLDNSHKYKDFEKIWNEIKKILEQVEDQVLKHMEWGQYADKSASVSDKYKAFINTIFPAYYNIWVKTRKLSPEEMQEYIKKMTQK